MESIMIAFGLMVVWVSDMLRKNENKKPDDTAESSINGEQLALLLALKNNSKESFLASSMQSKLATGLALLKVMGPYV